MRISIICVYNDSEQLNKCLIRSLKNQNIDYDLILVDGSNGNFSSCASALNYGVTRSNGEILVFTHQDVILKRSDVLECFTDFIMNMPVGTIAGAAGALEKKRNNIGNYTSGLIVDNNVRNSITSPVAVSCIDECFFGMKKSTYDMHKFDETLCDNWHLYSVEQCLFHRMHGDKIYVFPCQIHHLSKGTINLKYMDGLIKLANKYNKDFQYIWTTCYKVRSSTLYCVALRNLWLLNRMIRRKEY